MPDVPESRYADVPSEAMSRRQVAGTMAVSAAGPAAPVVPGLPVAAAHADEAGGGRGARVTGLAVDGREDGPLDLDDPAPRLSRRVGGAAAGWTQAACRIRAARTENDLDHRPRPDRPGPARRRPRRPPVGRPPPGGHPPELRLLPGTHHRQPRGSDDRSRAEGHGQLQEPHDPAADRGVVPQGSGGHPPGARQGRPARAGHRPSPGRRPHPCRGRLSHPVRRGVRAMDPQERQVPAPRGAPTEHHAEIRMPFGDHPTHVAGPGRHTFTTPDL